MDRFIELLERLNSLPEPSRNIAFGVIILFIVLIGAGLTLGE